MLLTLTVTSYQSVLMGKAASCSFGHDGGSIGRAPDNDWVLDDPSRVLSGHHAVIAYQDGAFRLTDNSTNGVFVNGGAQPIGRGQAVTLRNGDRLVLGDYEMRVKVAYGDQKVDPPRAAAGGLASGLDLGERTISDPLTLLDSAQDAEKPEPEKILPDDFNPEAVLANNQSPPIPAPAPAGSPAPGGGALDPLAALDALAAGNGAPKPAPAGSPAPKPTPAPTYGDNTVRPPTAPAGGPEGLPNDFDPLAGLSDTTAAPAPAAAQGGQDEGLPDDFDPLAGLNDATPAPASTQLPEGLDDFLEGIGAPEAEPPASQPTSAPEAAPAPAPAPAPQPAPAPEAGDTLPEDVDDLLAGLGPAAPAPQPAPQPAPAPQATPPSAGAEAELPASVDDFLAGLGPESAAAPEAATAPPPAAPAPAAASSPPAEGLLSSVLDDPRVKATVNDLLLCFAPDELAGRFGGAGNRGDFQTAYRQQFSEISRVATVNFELAFTEAFRKAWQDRQAGE